jgi:hypothetical protein
LTPTITDISGTVNSPVNNEALYLKISPVVPPTECPPILLRVNEIEKINIISLNQILYFSLFTSISLTFLFSYMIISNRRKIKWKKQQ